jgi:hypothetical protein
MPKPIPTDIQNWVMQLLFRYHCGYRWWAFNVGYEPINQALEQKNLKRVIETSGAYTLSRWIGSVFLKKNKLPFGGLRQSPWAKNDYYNKHDFHFAEEQAALVNENILYPRPEWVYGIKIVRIVEYVMKSPKWKFRTNLEYSLGFEGLYMLEVWSIRIISVGICTLANFGVQDN